MSATAAARVAGHAFHPTVLREYDIRGIIGETLRPADAHALGRAYATLLRAADGRRVCLGFDGRLSSPELAEALGEGLRAGGVDVLRIGRGPTPMLYFAVHHLDADGGLQVTGSHNPPSHNGFKMMLGKKSLYGARIQELGRIAASGDYPPGSVGSSTARCSTSTSTDCGAISAAAGSSAWSGTPATAPPARR